MPDTVTIKEYLEKRIDELEKSIDRRFASADSQVKIASAALGERLNSMNEFRAQLKDQTALMLTRSESDAQHEKIDSDIRSLRESRSDIQGKASGISMIVAIVIAVLSILISIYSVTKESDKASYSPPAQVETVK